MKRVGRTTIYRRYPKQDCDYFSIFVLLISSGELYHYLKLSQAEVILGYSIFPPKVLFCLKYRTKGILYCLKDFIKTNIKYSFSEGQFQSQGRECPKIRCIFLSPSSCHLLPLFSKSACCHSLECIPVHSTAHQPLCYSNNFAFFFLKLFLLLGISHKKKNM